VLIYVPRDRYKHRGAPALREIVSTVSNGKSVETTVTDFRLKAHARVAWVVTPDPEFRAESDYMAVERSYAEQR